MGWRDNNQGNLSAFDEDLGPVEVKMPQNIHFQEKEKVKTKPKMLERNGSSIFGREHWRIIETEEKAFQYFEEHYLRIIEI